MQKETTVKSVALTYIKENMRNIGSGQHKSRNWGAVQSTSCLVISVKCPPSDEAHQAEYNLASRENCPTLGDKRVDLPGGTSDPPGSQPCVSL